SGHFRHIVGFVLCLCPWGSVIARRLSQLVNPSAPVEEVSFAERQKDRASEALARLGKLVPGSGEQTPRNLLLMVRAGFRSSRAIMAMRGFKVLLPVGLIALVLVTGVYRTNPFLFLLVAAIVGYVLPELFLVWRVSRRQLQLRRGLPDGLDLLVICVESGLGLDQALMKVAQELR